MAAPALWVPIRFRLTEFGSISICQAGICCKGARSDPRHIPKFGETHAETGFDRECASSNPLTPAKQSGA